MTQEMPHSKKKISRQMDKRKNQNLWKNANDKKSRKKGILKKEPKHENDDAGILIKKKSLKAFKLMGRSKKEPKQENDAEISLKKKSQKQKQKAYKLKGILKQEPKPEIDAETSPERKTSGSANLNKNKFNKKVKPNAKNSETFRPVKRKSEAIDDSADKKPKLCELKKKERKLLRKKEGKNFEVQHTLMKLWEELRNSNCHAERKSQLLKQVCDLLKGRVKEFTYAHETVRVLECVLATGAETHRTVLFEELKNEIIPLSKAKYGKFFVIKMLRYGTKLQKQTIMNAFYGKVISLIRHKEAAEVVEVTFNECANALQRFELVQEFFGADYKFFKTSEIQSLGQILEKKPESKTIVIENMKKELMKVLEKNVVKHSIVHYVLLQFMLHCDANSRSEIIESLRPVVPEILHTKDGYRVAMHCVWHGTLKDRKAILKSISMFVPKIAIEEFGHMVLLTIFDCVDDTKAIGKYVIKELVKHLLEISQNIHGKKVLTYLMNPRDPHYIHPDVINILKIGDKNKYSKKDPAIRSSELKQLIAEPLLQLIISNISTLYKDNSFCLFTLIILDHVFGDRTAAFESIAKLAIETYTPEDKNIHVMEHPGYIYMLKQLILNDTRGKKRNEDSNSVTFSQVLVNTVPQGVLKSWVDCNRGAFILVSLLETEIPAVVANVKEELTGCKKHLAKKNYKGAEILLKKLKQ